MAERLYRSQIISEKGDPTHDGSQELYYSNDTPGKTGVPSPLHAAVPLSLP